MDYFAGLDVSVKETSVCIVRTAVAVALQHSRRSGLAGDLR
jgi:hypothetical protein